MDNLVTSDLVKEGLVNDLEWDREIIGKHGTHFGLRRYTKIPRKRKAMDGGSFAGQSPRKAIENTTKPRPYSTSKFVFWGRSRTLPQNDMLRCSGELSTEVTLFSKRYLNRNTLPFTRERPLLCEQSGTLNGEKSRERLLVGKYTEYKSAISHALSF